MAKADNSIRLPSKTTLNLAMKEKSQIRFGQLLLGILLIAIAAALFSKFCVYDRLHKVDVARAQLEQKLSERDALLAQTEGFEELQQEYARYSVNWMNEEERVMVLRTRMMDMLDKEIRPKAVVYSVSMVNNVLSVKIGDISLGAVSKLVEKLYTRDDILSVDVHTATQEKVSGGEQLATITMDITMTQNVSTED